MGRMSRIGNIKQELKRLFLNGNYNIRNMSALSNVKVIEKLGC